MSFAITFFTTEALIDLYTDITEVQQVNEIYHVKCKILIECFGNTNNLVYELHKDYIKDFELFVRDKLKHIKLNNREQAERILNLGYVALEWIDAVKKVVEEGKNVYYYSSI